MGIFIATLGLLTIGGCIYRLRKSTAPRWLLPAVVALGFVTVTVVYIVSLPRTESVTFRIDAPAARHVFVAGTFNGWNPRQYSLSEQSQGQWQTTISLPTGRHEYKFIVDSEWVYDVNNPNRVQLQPPLQGYNSVINVGSQDSLSSKR
jgi:1,4-alpha-glucan branching enzyme